MVGVVVEEDDDALVGQDHFGEGGPVREGHGDFGGGVGVGGEAGGLERGGEVADADVVAVADQDGHDVVGVGFHPAGDVGEIGLGGAGVEEVAGGVAVVQRIADQVGLPLQHANAVVELLRHA